MPLRTSRGFKSWADIIKDQTEEGRVFNDGEDHNPADRKAPEAICLDCRHEDLIGRASDLAGDLAGDLANRSMRF